MSEQFFAPGVFDYYVYGTLPPKDKKRQCQRKVRHVATCWTGDEVLVVRESFKALGIQIDRCEQVQRPDNRGPLKGHQSLRWRYAINGTGRLAPVYNVQDVLALKAAGEL